jgi:hypothetical protein
LGQAEFFDDQGMEEAGQVGAGGHAHVGEGFFYGAGSAYTVAGFEDEDALSGACEVGGAG